MKQLIKYPDPFLYNVSIPVDDPSKYFDTCVQMIKECNLLNGYALAAKQVGMLESFFVVHKTNSLPSDCPEMIFNPSIVNPVGQIFYKESCLSLPKITAKNKRFQEITLKYKDISILDLWSNFKSVSIQCSLDATGEPFNYLRSGATWEQVESNLEYLQNIKNLKISITLTLSNLNLWFLSDTMSYFKNKGILVKLNILHGPDYLSISTIPDELTKTALECVDQAANYLTPEETATISNMIINNNTQSLFLHTLAHILLLDKIRSEKLFDLLPFGEVSKKIILSNNGQ
jgi:peptide deformylase